MPVQKFRSVEEMPESRRVEPGSLEHVQRVRAALLSAQLLAAVFPSGVFKSPSIESSQCRPRGLGAAAPESGHTILILPSFLP